MDKFIENFKDVLDIEDVVTAETKFKDLEEWDSLAVITVLAMVNDEYGKIIKRKQFQKLETIADIYNMVQG